jgi:Tfp pilus assembly protein PilV
MELKLRRKRSRWDQRGVTIVEMLISSVVLIVGVLACAVLIPLSMGSNYRNRQQSNSTVIAQMVMQEMMSVPANTSPVLTITDCTGATLSVNTTGSAGGSGAPLLSSGQVDYSKTAPAGYSMLYTTCGTLGRQATYDVRWNIQSPSSYVKVITISAKLKGTTTGNQLFSLPVTIRSLVGQGT